MFVVIYEQFQGETAEQKGKQQLGGHGSYSDRLTRYALADGADQRILQRKVGGCVVTSGRFLSLSRPWNSFAVSRRKNVLLFSPPCVAERRILFIKS